VCLRATVGRVGVFSEAGRSRLVQGRAAFNRGEYFQAHEHWEEAWRELDGVERTVVQGLIQIAAGLHHLQQQRPRPAAELLRKGLAKLSSGVFAAPVELDVHGLARGVDRLLANLDTQGAELPDLTVLEI
jgi:uncharacterized protein